jgi:hypothetical protein
MLATLLCGSIVYVLTTQNHPFLPGILLKHPSLRTPHLQRSPLPTRANYTTVSVLTLTDHDSIIHRLFHNGAAFAMPSRNKRHEGEDDDIEAEDEDDLFI